MAVAIDLVHLLATGIWVGTLVPLALLLRAASGDDGADSRAHAMQAARRFSRVALVAMLVLIASGVGNAVVQVESLAGLIGTRHGRLLLVKLAVLGVILGLAVVNRTRVLPAIAAPGVMRRLAAFVGLEAGLALVLLMLAAAMTLTTPARHAEPVWPFPLRLSLDGLLDAPATRWRALLGGQLAVVGAVTLAAAVLVRRGRRPLLGGAVLLVAAGACLGLPPLVVEAYPTTYRRPLVAYQAASIASGMSVYRDECAACHGARGDAVPGADLRSSRIARRRAGEIFWLVSHGIARRGMPGYEASLGEAQRWDVINFIRALGAADGAKTIGPGVELDRAWLVAPDFTVAVGPLAPGALRDQRGRRMVLLVLYTLPESAPRMRELARSYDVLSIVGVEVIAVPTHPSSDAIRELGASPPVVFPVVTDGAADIVTTYGMVAPGSHIEMLIDRQGYIRAIWGRDGGAAPSAAAVQAEVEKLNAETNPPPFPDDHVH
jgi:putative copper resistance protein D